MLFLFTFFWIQGYDMEDAMIINKASYERGFAHGCVYKSEFVELKSVSCNCLSDNCILNKQTLELLLQKHMSYLLST